MSDDHAHAQTVCYTIHLDARHWWSKGKTITVMGTGSSVQGGELLIHTAGGLFSFNFSRVLYMEATQVDSDHEHQS